MKTIISMSASREFNKDALTTFCATFDVAAKVQAGETYAFAAVMREKDGEKIIRAVKALRYTIDEGSDVVEFSNARISGSITLDGAETTLVASFL